MKEAKISEIKNNLSRYLALVRRGETVRILDRDRPVAQIVPIVSAATTGDEALADMERKGLIRRGSGEIPDSIVKGELRGKATGALAALLEERDSR